MFIQYRSLQGHILLLTFDVRSKKSAIKKKKKRFGRECTGKACIGKVPTDWIEGNTLLLDLQACPH